MNQTLLKLLHQDLVPPASSFSSNEMLGQYFEIDFSLIFIAFLAVAIPSLNYLSFTYLREVLQALGGYGFIAQIILIIAGITTLPSIAFLIFWMFFSDFMREVVYYCGYYRIPYGQDALFMALTPAIYFLGPFIDEDRFYWIGVYLDFDTLYKLALPYFLLLAFCFTSVFWLAGASGSIQTQALQNITINRYLLYYFPMVALYVSWVAMIIWLGKQRLFTSYKSFTLMAVLSYVGIVEASVLNVAGMLHL
ncbi:hypothetical protein FGO68_gene4699 [Halteria grandinella]|uniref:Uncharacterized protein n=1 Tax=Halteria grandinella TaxID=5974 RepID=A0A8J8NJ81_HALGN|nr:hypothetical protein FGO68_gene4699 [Halteria grandinella]